MGRISIPPDTTKNFVHSWRASSRPAGRNGSTWNPARRRGFRGVANGCAGFRRHGRAAVVFEISDSQFSCFFIAWPAQRHRSGAGVAIVGALHHFEQQLQIGDGARHGTDDTDQRKRSAGRRIVTGGRNSSGRRLQSADAAEMRGHANRAAAVAAHSARRHPCGDSCGLAAARSAGRALEIPRIVGAAVEQVVGFPRHQKLGSVGYAQHNCAGIFQPVTERRILRRDESGPQTRSRFATQTGTLERTLDADGNAVQRAERTTGGFTVGHSRFRHQGLEPDACRVDMNVSIQLRIQPLDLREMSLGEFDRGNILSCGCAPP